MALAKGGVQEALCATCAERRAGLTGLAGLARAMVADPPRTDTCPHCGTTVEKARRTGLAGCPLCYSALADVWASLGAVPGRYAQGSGDLG